MVNMENLEITPSLIKELHKFEAKKTLYMVKYLFFWRTLQTAVLQFNKP